MNLVRTAGVPVGSLAAQRSPSGHKRRVSVRNLHVSDGSASGARTFLAGQRLEPARL